MIKKHVSMLLICAILLSNMVGMGGRAEAAANENIQISIQPDPEIDVALAVGNSSWNLQNFTNDLKTKLTAKGIASSGVNVQSVETKSVVADAANASLIFQAWKNFSIVSSGQSQAWTTSDYFISGDKLIRSNAGVTRPASGYYDPKSFDTTNATYSFTWGIDSTSYGAFDHGEAGFLFRMQDEQNYYAYLVDNHSACGNIFLDGGEAIVKVTNGTFQIIAQNSFPNYYAGQKENIKIEAEGNSIKVYRNGSLRLQATDSAYTKGGHGFYVWDQYGAYFSNISVESEATKKFSEVIRQPIWRENSERFIANLENNTLADLDQPQTSAEILTRLINDEVHYVALGTSTNMTQATQFVTRNNGRGTFINNTVYDTAMEQLATYIAAQIKARQNNSSYLLVNEPISINVTPSSYKTNTQNTEYPNGRWKIDHDYTYYENNLGQSSLSGQWQKDLPMVFDKPGKYELWFGSQHPNPQFIYVHRRPIAEFDMKVTKGSTYAVTLQDRSYDPDGESSTNRGIVQTEWKWRETTSTVWTNGQPPASLPLGKDYLVQLRVLDEQGAWSMPLAKFVSTGSTALKPIADFQLPSKVTTVKPLNVSDSSYDPAGRTISQKVWNVLKDGKSVYSGPQMISNFKSYGTGNYTVVLKVMNDVNLWSDEYQKTVQVVTDNANPTISYSPNGSEWTKPGLAVNLDFADDSGVAKTFYKVTGSSATPTAWDTGSSQERISLQLNNEGEWFIHARAEDLAGNVTTTMAGPYQIQFAPDVPVLKVNRVSQDSTEISWTLPNKSYVDGYKYSVRNTVTNKSWDLNYPTDHIQEDNLAPGTKYTYTLQVSNHAGTADSKPIEVLTLPAAPENLNTTFENYNSGKATISFEAVRSATKYVFVLYEGSNAGQVKVTEKEWAAAGDHSITGLEAGIQYSYSIQAANETGLGGVANSGFLSLPAMSGEFKTVHVTDHSVTMNWLESTTATQYQLDRDQEEVYSGTELEYEDDKLESSTEYNYRLAAKNASGFGDVSVLDVLTLPAATNVNITKIGAESIELEWDVVKGAERYIVSLNGNVEAEVPAGTKSVELDTLTPGTKYEVVVKAENKSGFGSYSPIQTITLPSAPDNITVNHTNDTTVTIEWPDTIGADRYKVHFQGKEIDLSSPSLDISDLSGDTEYTLQIQAGNNSGYGALQEVTFVTLPVSPIVQIDSFTSDKLNISWEKQIYADMYRVYDAEGNVLIETDQPSYELKKLNAGELYTFYVSAVNASGEGEKTAISQLTLPEAPADIDVKHADDEHVTVSWAATPGADRYRIYHDGKTLDIPSAQIDLLDLIGNKSYKIEVQAGNDAGFGIKTAFEFLTLPAEPVVQVDKYGSNEIHLSWDSQDDVTYRVYDEAGLLVETEDAHYQLEELKPGQTYKFWISVVNDSGESAKAEINQRTLPGGWDSKNPGHFVVVSDITTSSAKITWKAAEGAEYYKVVRDKQLLGTIKEPSNSFTLSGLESATNYYGFRIIAVNTAGDGAELMVPLFTTQAVSYGGTTPPKEEEKLVEEEEKEEPRPVNPTKPVPFKDIEKSFARKEIEALYQRGIVKGMSESVFSPNEKVTRVEFASMLVRALELQEASEVPLTFEDVQRTAWYVPELGTAILNGVAKGFSNKEFRPQDPITREQASKMLSNSFYTGELVDGTIAFKDADKIAVWAKPEVKALTDISIVNGYPDGSFKPKRDLTRAECAVLIYRALIELHDGAEYAPVTPQEEFAM